jgi:hypothetical protein
MNPCPSSSQSLASSSPLPSSAPSSPLLPLAQLIGVKRRREFPVTATTTTSPSPSTATSASTTTTTLALSDSDDDSDVSTIGFEERSKLIDQHWQREREMMTPIRETSLLPPSDDDSDTTTVDLEEVCEISNGLGAGCSPSTVTATSTSTSTTTTTSALPPPDDDSDASVYSDGVGRSSKGSQPWHTDDRRGADKQAMLFVVNVSECDLRVSTRSMTTERSRAAMAKPNNK